MAGEKPRSTGDINHGDSITHMQYLYNIHLTWFRGGETEEVGQAGRNASWVRVSNCARDFIDSMAVVE